MPTRLRSNKGGQRRPGTVNWDGTVLRRESDPLYNMRREADPTDRSKPDEPAGLKSAALWLKIARGSLVLALIAAVTLYVHLNPPTAAVQTEIDDESSFVAPRGTLDLAAEFAAIENYVDTPAPKQEVLPDPAAPLRLLDPAWNPSFNGG
jgi:hypothetical protein